MLFYQILTVVVFGGLILLAVLAFIEPGPLNRRSRTRHGLRPEDDAQNATRDPDNNAD